MIFESRISGLKPGRIILFSSGREESNDLAEYIRDYCEKSSVKFERLIPPCPQLEGYVMARRYNVASLDKDSVLYIRPGIDRVTLIYSLNALLDKLRDFSDWDSSSQDMTVMPLLESYDSCCCDSQCMPLSYSCESIPDENVEAEADELDESLAVIERERRELLRKMGIIVMEYVDKYGEMPPVESLFAEMKGKFILDSEGLSPLVVNGDMKIILPSYDEMELRLTPLCRSLYILFLAHPEGILLKNISDYSDAMKEIYSLVKPGADSRRAALSVEDMCDPSSDSLVQKISMIGRAMKSQLVNPRLSRLYSIRGERGGIYRIEAASKGVTLPRVLAGI